MTHLTIAGGILALSLVAMAGGGTAAAPIALFGVLYGVGSIIFSGAKDGTTSSVGSALKTTINDFEDKKLQEKLHRHKELLDEGILTQEEYDEKVSKIKDKMHY